MAISNLSICYEGIQRCYRNVVVRHLRARLMSALGTEAPAKVRELLKKEWADIARNAHEPRSAGYVAALVSDDFDLLSVSHFFALFEKFHPHLLDAPDASDADGVRKALLSWMREIKAVRDPMSHPGEADLPHEDAFRVLDSARRVVHKLGYAAEATVLKDLIGQPAQSMRGAQDGETESRPRTPLESRLPPRETVVGDFVGRTGEIGQLEEWFADRGRRRWMLTGDGGKGKSSLAFHLAERIRDAAPEGYFIVMWLSAKRRRFVEGDVEQIGAPDFVDLKSAVVKLSEHYGYPEIGKLPLEEGKARLLELLREFPALVVLDDVDSLDESGEDAFDFFYATVTEQTSSKILFTSRQAFKGFGSARTVVAGLSPEEAKEFVLSRCRLMGLDEARFTPAVIKDIVAVTEGSPLYLEDLLRLTGVVSPVSNAVTTWRDRGGDKAREYALKREIDSLGGAARSVLIAASFGRGDPSYVELGAITGFVAKEVESAISELKRLFLMPSPRLVEGDERFEVNANTRALVQQVYRGDDEYRRLEQAYRATRGAYPAAATGSRTPYIRQATLLVRSDAHAKAEALLQEALVRMPEDPGFTAFLGWVYKSWKPEPRLTDARERFARAHQLRWNHAEMYEHWVEMEIDAGEWSRAAEAAGHGYKRCKLARFAYLAGRANHTLGCELRQSLNDDKAKKQFETAQTQLEAAFDATPRRELWVKLVRTLVQNSDELGRQEAIRRFIDAWKEVAPADPALVIERSRVSRKYGWS
jgi:tetratricopeptide (TPR) repeat protein